MQSLSLNLSFCLSANCFIYFYSCQTVNFSETAVTPSWDTKAPFTPQYNVFICFFYVMYKENNIFKVINLFLSLCKKRKLHYTGER